MTTLDAVRLPILAMRDAMVFPSMVMPIFVGRPKSIEALKLATENDNEIVLLLQKDSDNDDPKSADLYKIGVSARIIQQLTMPDGSIKVLIEGLARIKVKNIRTTSGALTGEVTPLTEYLENKKEEECLILETLVRREFAEQVSLNKKIPDDVQHGIAKITNLSQLGDTIITHLPITSRRKQPILEEMDIFKRLQYLLALMSFEKEALQIEKNIQEEVKKQIDRSQRNYYINEQIKALQKELGQNNAEIESEEGLDDIQKLKKEFETMKMPAEAKEKALAEIQKLAMMQPMSPEATVIRTYLDWLKQMPWHKRSKVRKDLVVAEETLDSDHYGLERVKERILEYLAVQNRLNQIRGPILCLVGPPGVGKTSLGQSIANATGRKYVRMALGGVRDEAEIRGHRKTYIGALPGKLMQKMAKVGVKNPLFLLDEIDKMSSDMRGDPASALLEVLDPEQNNAFNDHYLEADYDLSEVMFVATSNSMNIPTPLLDRMEVIRLSGYTEDEKLNIAKRHLYKKQLERNGLKEKEISIDDAAFLDIIRYYTREAGVRNLEREIAKICRKSVKTLLTDNSKTHIAVTPENLQEFLGVRRFEFGKADDANRIGEVTGLAWTQVGGDLLTIESASVLGKGKLAFTGSLGDVMKESIQTAMMVVRSRAEKLGIAPDFYEKRDIHIHVPDGATPKDGPSAGLAMCTALVSCLTGNPVRSDVAMTGEINLRGNALPIGGLKEKLLAAHRGGIKTVLIPQDNVKDLEEVPDNVKAQLTITPVKTIDEVLNIALQNPPLGIAVESVESKPQKTAKKASKKTLKKAE